ncbi:glycine cleavage system protein GcvH [Acidocella sp.]|jgi:glycine cleavage system H protein|uniref:glycine cleavage system protein GcvH n=1 Tax=Acidocella sp. TaxID=50710 RepID=UPI002624A08A|nr:glycine cleavage system protein GcvH [Acidocella sp.]
MFYTKDHEWVSVGDDGLATVGITDHAQQALGDIVFVELPEPGRNVAKGEACAVVESVKAASDVYAPLSGTVAEVNQAIVDDPAKVNGAPEGDGWFFKLRLEDPAGLTKLLDRAAYDKLLETEA